MLSGEDDEENEIEEPGSKQASHMENWEDDEAGSDARVTMDQTKSTPKVM